MNRKIFEPAVDREPQSTYAASTCAALGIVFGASAAAIFAFGKRRSKTCVANLALAAGAFALAGAARLRAAALPPASPLRQPPLPDLRDGEPIDFSIIVPVYNRPREIATLLPALSRTGASSSGLGRGEILVIDDGSTDETAQTALEIAPRMSLETRVRTQANGGVASARNAGFAHARGRVCIVIDSDCIPEAGWLEAMLACARAEPRRLVFARIRRPKRPVYPLENLPDTKGFVGASFAMDRAAYLAFGGCHERYGASHDDRDMVLAALAAGCEAVHARDGWIVHPLRTETIASMWRVGLNSRFGNLYARRHGAYAARATGPTPYYFFGIGSSYGSSLALCAFGANAAIVSALFACDARSRAATFESASRAGLVLGALYASALAALGVSTGARPSQLPNYVATLATFQLATLAGRVRGSLAYGAFIL